MAHPPVTRVSTEPPMPAACVRLLQRLGIDPASPTDMRELVETVRWAMTQKAKQEQADEDEADRRRDRVNRRLALAYGVVASAFGIAMTWAVNHFTGSHL